MMEAILMLMGFLALAGLLLMPIGLLYLLFTVPPLTRKVKSLEDELETLRLRVMASNRVASEEPSRPQQIPAPRSIDSRPPEASMQARPQVQGVPDLRPPPAQTAPVESGPVSEAPVLDVENEESEIVTQEMGAVQRSELEADSSAVAAPDPEPQTETQPEAAEAAQADSEEVAPEVAPEPYVPRPQPTGKPTPASKGVVAMMQENILAVIGILVMFIGFAALIQYGASEGWFSFPIELRLAGIGGVAIAGTAFGWLQRDKRRAFGLALQGGGIGVLLMTVFSAFKFYELIPATVALGIAVILVAASGVLAVTQNASALAVLAILAGFASPLMMSTGSGNHVALFSFYAILNLAIFGMAWFRSWKWLNLLGFVFTFGIGLLWGVMEYSDEKVWSTLPFVVLFYALYLAIPLFNARLQTSESHGRPGFIDACLVFGNPFFTYLALSLLFQEKLPLAYWAFGLAVLNMVLGFGLLKMTRFRALGTYHAGIALVFSTMAVPLAFSASTTVGIFAVEGAVLVWLGLRNASPWQRIFGTLLFGLAAIFFIFTKKPEDASAIFNPIFMSGLTLAITGFATAAFYQLRQGHGAATLYFLWAMAWWLGISINEMDVFVDYAHHHDVLIALTALTIGLLAVAHRFIPAGMLPWVMALGYAAVLPLGLLKLTEHAHVFAGYGLPVWGGFAAVGLLGFFVLKDHEGDAPAWGHTAWLFAWGMALSTYLSHVAESNTLSQGWVDAAGVVPWLLIAAAIQFLPGVIGFPLSQFKRWRPMTMAVMQAWLFMVWLLLLVSGGEIGGGTWIPVINPVDLTLLGMLGVFAVWLRSDLIGADLKSLTHPGISLLFLVTVSNITLRSVHHITGVPWSFDLWDSATAQMSLTIVWSLFGMGNWIVGSKRGQRAVWQVGAVLIGLVLIKLIVVDRSHLGDLMGIGSFIGYGLLCLVVGYLAPAPPSKSGPAQTEPEPPRSEPPRSEPPAPQPQTQPARPVPEPQPENPAQPVQDAVEDSEEDKT